MNNPEEIEAKVRISNPAVFHSRMTGLAGEPDGPVLEVNCIFDSPDKRLKSAGSALRLREEFSLPGRDPRRTLLTFKGPRVPGPLKRRAEIELEVEAAGPLVAILAELGMAEVFRYEKRRTTWRVADCEVVLDELPHLGWFAEVEGPTEEAVMRVLADVGLAGEPTIPSSYIHLLRDHLRGRGMDPGCAVF
ncbi:MAG: class IV adenylate cyclase [Planctomycetes bacterium]|nr:class IV adenylate cyclase [Planctomycetota bacterium]